MLGQICYGFCSNFSLVFIVQVSMLLLAVKFVIINMLHCFKIDKNAQTKSFFPVLFNVNIMSFISGLLHKQISTGSESEKKHFLDETTL